MSFVIPKLLVNEIERQVLKLQERGGASGFQLALGFRDECVGVFHSGVSDQYTKYKMSDQVWMDLASLTKIISTVSLLIETEQRKLLPEGLQSPLRLFFPSFASELKNKTIWDLLHHQAGLPAIFDQTDVKEERDERIRFFLDEVDRSFTNVDCHYSDVGFILLGLILEKVHQKRLRVLFQDSLAYSEGLGFGPIPGSPFFVRWLGGRGAASQFKLDAQEYLTPGVSQDPRAQWLHGDAGHAGLWGTAQGVERWAQQLYRAYHGKDIRWSDRVVRRFIDFDRPTQRWRGGFDTPTQSSQSGTSFPRTTIGHLGYTGASFWMDLESGARVTLLCHRFDEGIQPDRLRALRPDFHDWLWANVFSKLSS